MKVAGAVLIVLLAGAVAAAQPAPTAATEDRDDPGDASLPWYLPAPVTKQVVVAPPPKSAVLSASLSTHSVSGDLSGSITTVGVYYDTDSFSGGVAIGSESLGLTELVKDTNTMRSVENDSAVLLVSASFGRNGGREVARKDELHIFALYPSLEMTAGFAGEQVPDGVQAMGPKIMGIAGLSLAVTGARIGTCSGWFADIRFPVVSVWGAVRSFDPTMMGPDNDISASGTSYGLTIEVGHNKWKRVAAPSK